MSVKLALVEEGFIGRRHYRCAESGAAHSSIQVRIYFC